MWAIAPAHSTAPPAKPGEQHRTCTACEVSWRGLPDSPCWVCGAVGGAHTIGIWS